MGRFLACDRVSTALLSAVAVVVCLSSAGPARAAAFTDDFNRGAGPDNSDIGPNWAEQAGNFFITSGTLRAPGPATSVMTVVGYSETAPTVSADVNWPSPFNGGGLGNEVGVIARYADLANSVHVTAYNTLARAGFDQLHFYYGAGGVAWSGMTGGGKVVDVPTFYSGRLTASVVGPDVTATVDTNFDGIPEYTYTRGGLPLANLGTGVGLMMYFDRNGAAVGADNFAALPEPSGVLTLAAAAAAGLLPRRRR